MNCYTLWRRKFVVEVLPPQGQRFYDGQRAHGCAIAVPYLQIKALAHQEHLMLGMLFHVDREIGRRVV